MHRTAALAVLLCSTRALAADALAVLAAADAPAGPGSSLTELTHALRAACSERDGAVLGVPEMRARLAGAPTARLEEVERACAAAEGAIERAEYEGAVRALRDVAAAAEAEPPSARAHALLTRALARLAYAERLLKDAPAAAATLDRLVAAAPAFAADPAQYPPSYLKDLEAARRRAAAEAKEELAITSNAEPAEVFVDGRPCGTTPVKVSLPPGRHRVAAAGASSRVPASVVELAREPGAVVLDVATAGALRLDAGPGIAATAPERRARALGAAAWLGAGRVVVASVVAEAGAPLLAATLYDVARGAAVREGRVRMEGGTVPAARLGALAAFLLTGAASREVTAVAPKLDLTAPAPAPATAGGLVAAGPPSPRRGWMRPAAYGSGGVALGLVGLAVYEAIASRNDTRAADALPRPDGAFASPADHALYDSRRASAASRQTIAYVSAASAGAFAIAAGVLGYLSRDERGAPVVRF